jgi:hypothetical protein
MQAELREHGAKLSQTRADLSEGLVDTFEKRAKLGEFFAGLSWKNPGLGGFGGRETEIFAKFR